MTASILVVSTTDTCRSALGAALLRQALQVRGHAIPVETAGLAPSAGAPADALTCHFAQSHGMFLDTHRARSVTTAQMHQADLILTMDQAQRSVLTCLSPAQTDRILLFDHWIGAKGILDPRQRSTEFLEAVFLLLRDAAHSWAQNLSR